MARWVVPLLLLLSSCIPPFNSEYPKLVVTGMIVKEERAENYEEYGHIHCYIRPDDICRMRVYRAKVLNDSTKKLSPWFYFAAAQGDSFPALGQRAEWHLSVIDWTDYYRCSIQFGCDHEPEWTLATWQDAHNLQGEAFRELRSSK